MMTQNRTYLQDTLILSLLIGVFFSIFLGSRPLSVPDEGRYTEIPREMVATNDFVTPRLNGVKYFEKPPLMYWLASASIKGFDVNEWALRFWPAFFALMGCIATYMFGRRFYSREVGIAGAVILATNLLYYAHSRILILDMPVAVLITCSLFSFFAALFSSDNKLKQRILLGVFFICAAGAMLTKGLMGVALPGSVILLWALINKRWDALKLAFTPWGILLFLILAAPWHILAAIRNPNFFDFYFIHEQILRFLTSVHNRSQPFWFFAPIIVLGLFPWIAFLPQAIKETYINLKNKKSPEFLTSSYLAIWIVFIFGFFSISNSKLIPYIVPIFPPMALLIGQVAIKTWNSNNLASLKWPLRIFYTFCVLLIIAMPVAVYIKKLAYHEVVVLYAALSVSALAIGIITTSILQKINHAKGIIAAICLTGVFTFIPLNIAWIHLEGRSIKPLAMELKQRLKKDDIVVAWQKYYQDLPPYIGQTVTVVEAFNEMTFGTTIEDVSAWMINEDQFAELLKSDRKIYIMMRSKMLYDLLAKHPSLKTGLINLQIIKQNANDVLLVR